MSKDEEAMEEALGQEMADRAGWTAFADRVIPLIIVALILALAGLSAYVIAR